MSQAGGWQILCEREGCFNPGVIPIVQNVFYPHRLYCFLNGQFLKLYNIRKRSNNISGAKFSLDKMQFLKVTLVLFLTVHCICWTIASGLLLICQTNKLCLNEAKRLLPSMEVQLCCKQAPVSSSFATNTFTQFEKLESLSCKDFAPKVVFALQSHRFKQIEHQHCAAPAFNLLSIYASDTSSCVHSIAFLPKTIPIFLSNSSFLIWSSLTLGEFASNHQDVYFTVGIQQGLKHSLC